MEFASAGVGNLLLAVASIDKAAGSFHAPPGWTLAFQHSGTSISLAAMYRLVVGEETAATLSWSYPSLGGSWLVAEYTGLHVGDPLGPVRVSPASDTARTNMVVNPPITEAHSIVLAVFGIDSMNSQSSGDTGGIEFRPRASGWNWITTSYHRSQGGCPGTALSEYGTTLTAGANLPDTRFAWARSDQAAGATLQLNVGPRDTAPSVVSRWVGAVTATSATVAVTVVGAATTRLRVATDPALTTDVVTSPLGSPDLNGTVHLRIGGLSPGTQYHYGVEVDGAVDTSSAGRFRTAGEGSGDFTFAFGSCCSYPDASAFAEIRRHDPDLFVHLGDLFYGDISNNDPAAFRARFDTALRSAHQGALYSTVPTVYTWSDHDFGPNGSNGTSPSKAAAQQVYREYVPAYPMPSTTGGIYQTFVYRRVRFIVTDNRSYKSPQSDPDDATKTILGAEQKQWFKDTISSATEPVIIWVNENPWIGAASTGSDRWSGYTTERTELAQHMRASGKSVAIISGDMHALAADDGSHSPGGIPVFHAASLYGSSSHKGGPYTHGPYPQTIGVNTQQFGLMRVVDSGSEIALQFTGYEVGGYQDGGTPRLSYTKRFTV